MKLSAAATTGLASLLGGALTLAGCSSSAEPATPAAAPPAKPSASVAPAVQLVVPATVNGLPRQKAAKWTKISASKATFLEAKVLSPTGTTVAAAYLDPDDISETVELSAAAGVRALLQP